MGKEGLIMLHVNNNVDCCRDGWLFPQVPGRDVMIDSRYYTETRIIVVMFFLAFVSHHHWPPFSPIIEQQLVVVVVFRAEKARH